VIPTTRRPHCDSVAQPHPPPMECRSYSAATPIFRLRRTAPTNLSARRSTLEPHFSPLKPKRASIRTHTTPRSTPLQRGSSSTTGSEFARSTSNTRNLRRSLATSRTRRQTSAECASFRGSIPATLHPVRDCGQDSSTPSWWSDLRRDSAFISCGTRVTRAPPPAGRTSPRGATKSSRPRVARTAVECAVRFAGDLTGQDVLDIHSPPLPTTGPTVSIASVV